jgi:cytochrome c-type protein NapB
VRRLLLALGLATAVSYGFAQPAGGLPNALRGATPLDAQSRPALLPKPVNDDVRRARSFPAQPPVIPHQVDNYQIDLRFNKCMSCHGRERVGESQAPMVSVTHFLDRDGQMRQEISPRRYFCTQCHVPQTDARPPVKNTFQDFYDIQSVPAKGPGR